METVTMTDATHQNRTKACQRALSETDADAVVLFPSTNMYYLSGFRDEPMERHLLLFVTESESIFVVPGLYGHEVTEHSCIESVWTWSDDTDPLEVIERAVNQLSLSDSRILIDDRMWATFTHDLRETLPESTFDLASSLLDPLRITKDQSELTALRGAAKRADTVSEQIRSLGANAIGQTESELASEIETLLSEAGCAGTAFEPIVGSGPNGAKPHHRNSDRIIEDGDPVVLDFGGWYNQYPGDQTRTVVFDSSPPSPFRDAYTAVREALEAGIEFVEPGVTAEAVDRTVREVVESHGFGEEFIHRTGHGVGLDVHEPPYIVEGNGRTLEPGMVFSVEPGVYVEGEFGVRVEDLVAVTPDSCERLNNSPRTWKPL